MSSSAAVDDKHFNKEEYHSKLAKFNSMTFKEIEVELKLLPRSKYNELRKTVLKKLTYEYSSLDDFDRSSFKNLFYKSLGLSAFAVFTQKFVSSDFLKVKANINVNKYFLGRVINFKRGFLLFLPISFYLTGEFLPIAFRVGLKHIFINTYAGTVKNDKSS